MRTEAQIQRRAMQILVDAGVQAAPVNPHRIAQHLEISVQPEFAADDISGALYRRDDGVVIGVNAAHHPNRQRFTIAHEIGHYILHDDPVYVDRTYASTRPARESPAFLRDRVSGEAVDPVEIEANRFAASLLMPRDFLMNDLESEAMPIGADAVERLAKEYQVSVQALTYRLTNLGVPLDLGF